MAKSSSTVARAMRELEQVLSSLEARKTSDATIRSRAEALLNYGTYPLRRKGGGQVRADVRAWANILRGVHVSALATPALVRGSKTTSRRASRQAASPL